MVLIDKPHEFLETVLGLESFLLGLPVLIRLFLVNLLLVLEAVLRFVEADLNGNEVGLHAVSHVLILALDHELVVVSVFYFVKLVLGASQTIGLAHDLVFDVVFFVLRLLKFSLQVTTGYWLVIQVFLGQKLTFFCSSSFSFASTVLWMLSYFMRMRLRVALTSLFSSSPNSQEGMTLLGSSKVLDGTKEY